jgi:uncharacterized protein YecT (DUF1311 family)
MALSCSRRALVILFVIASLTTMAPASEAGKEYAKADSALNAAYQAILTAIKDPQQRASLVEAQKAWIKYRDANATFFATRYEGSKGALFFKIHLTTERTEFLKALRATPPDDDPTGMKPSGYED